MKSVMSALAWRAARSSRARAVHRLVPRRELGARSARLVRLLEIAAHGAAEVGVQEPRASRNVGQGVVLVVVCLGGVERKTFELRKVRGGEVGSVVRGTPQD